MYYFSCMSSKWKCHGRWPTREGRWLWLRWTELFSANSLVTFCNLCLWQSMSSSCLPFAWCALVTAHIPNELAMTRRWYLEISLNETKHAPAIRKTTLQVEVIGGAEKYMAVCRKCFFSEVSRFCFANHFTNNTFLSEYFFSKCERKEVLELHFIASLTRATRKFLPLKDL